MYQNSVRTRRMIEEDGENLFGAESPEYRTRRMIGDDGEDLFDTESREYRQFRSHMYSRTKGLKRESPVALVRKLEVGKADFGRKGGASRAQMMDNFMPVHFQRYLDDGRNRFRQYNGCFCRFLAYNGIFNRDGSMFITAGNDQRVLVYDTSSDLNEWKRKQTIQARAVEWTITDMDISPSQRFLAFSSLNPFIHLVRPFPPHTHR